MSVYAVTGRVPYRGHQPGEKFEAHLEKRAELRAIRRGNITLIDDRATTVRKGSYTLPTR